MSSGWVAACSAVSWICSFTACLACIPDLDPFSKKARQKSLVMNCALDGKSTVNSLKSTLTPKGK